MRHERPPHDTRKTETPPGAVLETIHGGLVSVLGHLSIARAVTSELDRRVQLDAASRGLIEVIALIERSSPGRSSGSR